MRKDTLIEVVDKLTGRFTIIVIALIIACFLWNDC